MPVVVVVVLVVVLFALVVFVIVFVVIVVVVVVIVLVFVVGVLVVVLVVVVLVVLLVLVFVVLVFIVSLDGLDSMKCHPCLSYSLYIDDNGLHAVGGYLSVISGIVEGSRQLHRAISEGIGATLAEGKAMLLRSNKPFGLDIQSEIGASDTGPLCTAATN